MTDALYVAASGLRHAAVLLDTAASNVAGRLAGLASSRVAASADAAGGVRTHVVPAPGGDLLDDALAIRQARHLTALEEAYVGRITEVGRWLDRLG